MFPFEIRMWERHTSSRISEDNQLFVSNWIAIFSHQRKNFYTDPDFSL